MINNKLELGGGKRVAFLDCLRGFTMIMVVWHHITLFSFDIQHEESFIAQLMMFIRMPTFFFVSGMIAYKAVHHWTFGRLTGMLTKKARVQLVPTIVFFALFYLLVAGVVPSQLPQYFADYFPGKYWFTAALFVMFAIYYTTAFVCRKVAPRMFFPIIIVIALAMYLSAEKVNGLFSGQTNNFHLWELFGYMIFFTAGLAFGSNLNRFIALIDGNRRFAARIAVIVAGVWACNSGMVYGKLFVVLRLAVGFCGIAVLFLLFYRTAGYWNGNSAIARMGRYIGRRTLDIYMIHYFFLPSLTVLTPYIIGTSQTLPLILVVGTLTAVNIALCLLISAVLRQSPFLAKWLFGQSGKKNPEKAATATD